MNLQDCMKTWRGTLEHFGISRGVSQWEETQIARAERIYGAELVELALFGARFEKKTDKFDPKDYLSLARILEKDRQGVARIDLYANAGDRKRKSLQPSTPQEPEIPTEQKRTDPARVREIIANVFKPVSK